MKSLCALTVAFAGLLVCSGSLFSHCEIPCGIYDDHMRIHMIEEHITTIEKGMNEISSLQKAGDKNYNQLVRWIANKDDHANQLQEIVWQYWMAQRIKPAESSDEVTYKKYRKELELLHKLSVEAMKAKQTLDLAHVKSMRSLLQEFEKSYFEEM